MNIRVRHISGSRAGEVQTFDSSEEISIGRNPSSMVLFDPEKDRVVSGRHASIVYSNERLTLRDLGSSNGTFIDGNPVKERVLRNGEIVQLGAHGPKIQIEYDAPEEVAATYVVPLDELKAPTPTPEGRTVMMMMPPTDQVAAGPAVAPSKRKKGGIGRALLIVGAVFAVLVVGVVVLALVMRSVNVKKRKGLEAKATQTQTADPAAQAAQQQKLQEAEKLKQQIAQTQQNLQQTQASIENATAAPGGASSGEAEDLRRQLAESQAMLEQMTRELQAKNDEIATAKAKGSQQPQIRYVPTPTPTTPKTTTARPVTTSKPETTATRTATSTPTTTPVTTSPTTPTANNTTSTAQLYTGKRFKKRLLVTPLPPEIPPANLPSGTARDLANLLGTALVSTGDYVIGQKGQASISVMVTNYRADQKKTADVKKTADNARKVGRLFGQKVPTNPVDVKSTAYDAAMSARVRLFDPSGRLLTEAETSAASADRKSKVALGGVSFHEVAMSDTAVGDVARKVVADAVEALTRNLSSLDWYATVSSSNKQKVTLAAGFGAGVEPGDVFDVSDGKSVTRIRVTNVNENTAEAEYLTAAPKGSLSGKTAKYAGSENPPSAQAKGERSLTMRIKSPVYDGPGNSFNELKTYNPGARFKLHYVVGSWGKASDSSGTYWVPLAAAQISS